MLFLNSFATEKRLSRIGTGVLKTEWGFPDAENKLFFCFLYELGRCHYQYA